MGVYVLYSPEFRYEFAGSDLSHTLDAGNVVGCIAAYRKYFDYLLRSCDVIFLADLLHVNKFVVASGLARFVLDYVRTDQLAIVFVRGYHVGFESLSLRPFCHRAYHVVRLIAFQHQDRKTHGLAQFAQRLKGVYHKLRGLASCALVFRVHFMSERTSRWVERYSEVGRFLPFDQFEDVFCESEEDGHVRTLGVDHRVAQECIVHLEYQGMSVYQE